MWFCPVQSRPTQCRDRYDDSRACYKSDGPEVLLEQIRGFADPGVGREFTALGSQVSAISGICAEQSFTHASHGLRSR